MDAPETGAQQFDVCLSYASEQYEYVRDVAEHLKAHGIRVFFDDFETIEMWGKDLCEHLDRVYRHAARYCVVFQSADYARKAWTNHERKSALARALDENQEYLLPARFDDTEVPGLRPTIKYVDLRGMSPREFAALIQGKVGASARSAADPAATTGDPSRPGGARTSPRHRRLSRSLGIRRGRSVIVPVAVATMIIIGLGAAAKSMWTSGSRPAGSAPTASSTTASSTTGSPTPTASPNRAASPATSGTSRNAAANPIKVRDGEYYDFDQAKADLTGGPGYEVKLGSPHFYFNRQQGTWGQSTIAVIDNSRASAAGCRGGEDPWKDGKVHLDWLGTGQSLCISTSGGKWALLKLIGHDHMAEYTFDLQMVG
ncbi:toll/interleukin-1 receptor domain-containing protein [Virgisporangium aurantiacum]|uniref:toll/interleukin-1 receptor domain-containing protein n=1 Tax=Virgisporangium aurantiacum TaxID=175570 RepID=UPI00194FB105|nr:TIR domain-containing protein [Virgisporangium aurantiacum]